VLAGQQIPSMHMRKEEDEQEELGAEANQLSSDNSGNRHIFSSRLVGQNVGLSSISVDRTSFLSLSLPPPPPPFFSVSVIVVISTVWRAMSLA